MCHQQQTCVSPQLPSLPSQQPSLGKLEIFCFDKLFVTHFHDNNRIPPLKTIHICSLVRILFYILHIIGYVKTLQIYYIVRQTMKIVIQTLLIILVDYSDAKSLALVSFFPFKSFVQLLFHIFWVADENLGLPSDNNLDIWDSSQTKWLGKHKTMMNKKMIKFRER